MTAFSEQVQRFTAKQPSPSREARAAASGLGVAQNNAAPGSYDVQ